MKFRDRIEHTSTLLTGMVLGATAMYILDAQSGGRRRALARDRVIRGGHLLGRWSSRIARDAANRAWGQVAEMRSSLRDRGATIDDQQLVERVRAQLGHVVSHPGSLQITATDGVVTVAGPVMTHDVDRISDRLSKTRGVRDFNLQVEPHERAGSEPGLQGQPRQQRRGWRVAG